MIRSFHYTGVMRDHFVGWRGLVSTPEYAAVRIASPADIVAVQAVANTTWHATYDTMLSAAAIDVFLQRAYSEYALRQTLNNGGLWVLETSGAIGGYVRLDVQDAVGQLNAIYVCPELQGRGYGLRLWRCALAWFEARQVNEVQLSVAEKNLQARGFYNHLGFEEMGERHSTLLGEPLAERICLLRLEPSTRVFAAADETAPES